ncbi:MAG TPA: ATP-binding protein [Candidatus Saccharibacteria bacterium]|jgi:predicted ATPase|nr:ATP-binding protein [Candidatus Saccharibacteria bacterium]HMT55624.1 ATP-binding protein [Candidatus Saccharibacteria bacterium]
MSDKILRIVLTGAPCGGKSTTIKTLSKPHSDAYCAPEVASILLGGGYPAPDALHTWSQKWQNRFQSAVAMTQLALEKESEERARNTGARVIIYDRGLLDGASYLAGGIAELEKLSGMDEKEMLDRYDVVVHLPTIATKNENQYEKISNSLRIEDVNEVLLLEQKVLDAWERHPNRHIIEREHAVDFINDIIKKHAINLTSKVKACHV